MSLLEMINPFSDPFVVFILVLTIIIGVGGLYIDKYGRMPPERKDNDEKPKDAL